MRPTLVRQILRALVSAPGGAAFFGLLAASPALAQSINIALGAPGTPPSSSYGAAGQVGVWNDIGLTPIGQRFPLVGLDGAPLAADIRQVGATAVLQSNDPATSGDDEALLDSMVTSMCVPLDACYWIDHLANGPYVVTMYALTPNNAALLSSVRVDDATPTATLVGGAWGGVHIEGLSYQSFLVEVVDGEIGLHSGVPSSGQQSGLNGIQIRPATALDVGSIGAPGLGPESELRLAAFPNPASGAQTIELAASLAGSSWTLEIVDVLGRVAWSERVIAGADGRARITWDGRTRGAATTAAAGVYVARLTPSNGGQAGDGTHSLASPATLRPTPIKLIRTR